MKLTVKAADLASFDTKASAWVVSAAKGKFIIGSSSEDVRATLTADVKASTTKVADVLRPQQPLNLLQR